ncbi:MAG: hydroxymethylglutaryl-CoA lyase [Polyangiaceae bacterium]|jgi:hydroxymethylglutaryl-CoA lyase|nr:hydroxymethylglutaryl-CoA lyase [Polyangiaceae bacterium]
MSGELTLIEVGPREGFQTVKQLLPTPMKLQIINGLVRAGLRHVQVASFVSPKLMPQMADADEVCAGLTHADGVCFSGLCLNVKGVERARDAGLHAVDVSISASDTHGRKNAGKSLDEARVALADMIRVARQAGLKVRAGLQCVFGCAYEGEISEGRVHELVDEILAQGVDMLSLADSPGMAHPRQVTALLGNLLPNVPRQVPVVLHFHDTRGLGMANLMAALDCGVTHFDTALGGIGGCPFIPGAAGNIATEDVGNLAAQMGMQTRIDLSAVARWTRNLEEFLGTRFPGKLHFILNKD